MAIAFEFGAAMETAITPNLYPWNYADAFRVISDNGSIARMTDILAPLDMRTTIKVTVDKIANVYTTLADGNVPAENQLVNVSGQTVFCELKTIATETIDSVEYQLPMVARVELRLPNSSLITEANVLTLILAAVAGLCDDSGVPTVVTEKMRGALTPAGI